MYLIIKIKSDINVSINLTVELFIFNLTYMEFPKKKKNINIYFSTYKIG